MRLPLRMQIVGVVCFLRATLLELTDVALLQAGRRVQQLVRSAAERAQTWHAGQSAELLQQAARARAVLHDEAKGWRDRVLEEQSLLAGVGDATAASFGLPFMGWSYFPCMYGPDAFCKRSLGEWKKHGP